ncbi:MAG: choice-of-anchor L domain-containing protein, partial [Saprospiraceae bacterium]
MRNRSNTTFYIFFLLFGLFSTSLYAQQNPVVRLEGEKMRTAVQVTKGISTLTLCGLEPGISYSVIAVPMAYGQESTFEIAPAPALTKGTGGFPFMREGKNALKFAAPSACVDIQVNARSTEQGEQLPMYLTISSEMKATPVASTRNSAGKEGQAILQVQGGFSAEELVKDVLVGGGCFQISNVSFSGLGSQIGKFSKGLTNIGFDNGLIMATGNIDLAPGPNDHDGSSFGYGINTPDADLQTLTAGTIYDMANIEFDFVPTQNQVVFEFAFASEEYCEYVNTNFNDVFGFFISGPGIVGTKNIAVIPNTNTPISINTLNHLVNSGLYTHNTPITGKNCGILPAFGQAVLELQYDGFTKKMTAIANVIPCQSYHIKLKIADVADGVWDSAVFFRANSFNAGGTVLASPAYPGGSAAAFESCDAGNIRFRRSNTNTSLPLPINFTIGGSATPGVDYVPIPNFVVIPAGQMEVLAPITVLPDLIPEGPENILVTIPNSCSCSQSTIEFVINDRPSLVANASDQLLCEGEIATLQAAVTGGIPGASIQYQWSTGVTTASIQSSTAGAYSVTVSDGCSIPAVATFGLAFTVCSCEAETFIKTIGKAGQNVRGYAIYDSQDGNLYLTGSKLDSAAIIKITPAGTVLWMRTFDVKNGAVDRISELIVDSEGMLVGCGQSGDLQPDVTGFVFRYNPVTNNLQWVNTYGLETPYVMGLMELPNGNYLIYDNPHLGVNDNRMLEITRSDGAILTGSPLSQKLNLGGGDNFNSALIFNGRLYGVGRYTNGSDFVNMRHALSSIDLATGNVIWSRLSHIDANENARLYGMDLLIEDNHIISVGFGSEVDDNLNNSQLFLQKTSLNGNLIWVKRFDITEIGAEVVDELVSVPDGFILYARGSNAPSDLYLIKTDKNGVLQWSKKLDYGFNDYVATASTFQSQILVKDNHLFFVASTEGPGESQMLIAKTTLDGTVEGNCDFIKPVPVITSAVTNPANFSVNLEKVPFDELTFTIVRTPAATQMQVQNQCKVFINQQQQFSLCFGESVTIGGLIYTQDTTFLVEIPGNGGCDTLRTYSIDLLPQITRNIAVTLCPGDFVLIGGQMIDHAGTFILSIDGMNGACDTTEIYTIASAPYQTRSESISFCEGSSVTIGGQVYNQSGIVIDTIPAVGACDTIVTYTITKQPKLSRAETLVFCPGESIILGGTAYTQPGTVELNLPSSTGGCDTLVT